MPRKTHGNCGLFRLIFCGLAAQALWAQQPLTVRVRTESAPAGGWAQVKIYCEAPAKVVNASLSLDLDPAFFGPIVGIAAFSASGDALGSGGVSGSSMAVRVTSLTGGLCQLPGVPIFAVTARVLADASGAGWARIAPGSSGPFTGNEWTDPQGNSFNVTMLAGEIRAEGMISVERITPGGGVQPAGTALHIHGTGFRPDTSLTADGLQFASVEYVSATELRATLASTAQIAGVPFHVGDVTFFPALRGAPEAPSNGPHVILPLRAIASASYPFVGRSKSVFIQNPHPAALRVRLVRVGFPSLPVPAEDIEIPAGGFFTRSFTDSLAVYPEKPAVMGGITAAPGAEIYGVAQSCEPSCIFLPPISLGTSSQISFEHQVGTNPPLGQERRILFNANTPDATIETQGGSWLRVTENKSATENRLTIAADPTGLAPGRYEGSIRITPVVAAALSHFPVATTEITVTLRVSENPTIRTEWIDAPSGLPRSFQVLSNGTPAPFSVAVDTEDGGNWVTTDIQAGTTPATVNVQIDTAGLPGGHYYSTLTIQGPINSIQHSANATVEPLPKPPLRLDTTITSLTLEEGTGGATMRLDYSDAAADFRAEIENAVEHPWVTLQVFRQPPVPLVDLGIDRNRLPLGTHTLTVVASAGGHTIRTPVTIRVLPRPTRAPVVNPPRIDLSTTAGTASPRVEVTVASTGSPEFFSVRTKLGSRVRVISPEPRVTPATLGVSVESNTPASFDDELIVSNSAGETRIPLRVQITAAPRTPPTIGSVVNAASSQRGGIAPGEIISLHGMGVGGLSAGLQVDSGGKVAANAPDGSRVLVNGMPAPIVYASVAQWNVAVPYEIDGATSATIQTFVSGVASEQWTVPVVAASPALWTISASGVGPAAAVNQNGTINAPANPAPRGTVVSFYMNGEGQTLPAGETGSVTGNTGARPRLPVSVTIGGREANVLFAGAAPDLISGVTQVNILVPFDLAPDTHEVRVKTGDFVSPSGVTIVIE